ncbi:MAG TPA: AMP-dependent synthetase/ligase [Thermoleophilaceae bacterium]|nr:AMP-dependent synthetase/ligase [Thermoleophilaceae bacterium]
MEVAAVPAVESSTGSKTMADLALLAARKHAGHTALKYKNGDQWTDVSFEEFGDTVRETALGLMSLGLEKGDRVSILSNTRPEWAYACFSILSAGGVSVSIYQTNSPSEVQYVANHSESKVIFAEDAEQLAKVRTCRADLPHLEHIVIFEPSADSSEDAVSLDDLRAKGREADQAQLDERIASVNPDDQAVFIYTSGTTGPPKGVMLTHDNYRQVVNMTQTQGTFESDDLVYLFLPLAHAFALLVQFGATDLGAPIAYWEKDPQKIVPNLMEVKPTYFPSVPRIFEKIYTMATTAAPDRELLDKAVELGMKVRLMEERGEPIPDELKPHFERAEQELFQNVRNLFGGRIRQAVTGAAPIAKEILEFFFACGVPIFEGYGMTETSTVATVNTLEAHRFGSVGKALPGVEIKIGDDGEILLRGPNMMNGYYKNEEATKETLEPDGWLHTGDLGYLDEDGFLFINGRKKDIIITAGGKNITPANLENGLKQNRWISQAVVIGDRRPYLVALVTLDPEEVPKFAEENGIAPEDVHDSDAMREEIQKVVDGVNADYGRVEQIKKFTVLPEDLSQEQGTLTPTLKVKRNVVNEKFEQEIEKLYG